MKDNQYLIGTGAHTELGGEPFLPHSVHLIPHSALGKCHITKTRKGPSGSLLFYQNITMNRMSHRQFSVLFIAQTEYLEASGDPVTTIYHP